MSPIWPHVEKNTCNCKMIIFFFWKEACIEFWGKTKWYSFYEHKMWIFHSFCAVSYNSNIDYSYGLDMRCLKISCVRKCKNFQKLNESFDIIHIRINLLTWKNWVVTVGRQHVAGRTGHWGCVFGIYIFVSSEESFLSAFCFPTPHRLSSAIPFHQDALLHLTQSNGVGWHGLNLWHHESK